MSIFLPLVTSVNSTEAPTIGFSVPSKTTPDTVLEIFFFCFATPPAAEERSTQTTRGMARQHARRPVETAPRETRKERAAPGPGMIGGRALIGLLFFLILDGNDIQLQR